MVGSRSGFQSTIGFLIWEYPIHSSLKGVLKELRHGLCILKNLAKFFSSRSFAIRVNLLHP